MSLRALVASLAALETYGIVTRLQGQGYEIVRLVRTLQPPAPGPGQVPADPEQR